MVLLEKLFTKEQFQMFCDYMVLKGLTIDIPSQFARDKERLGLASPRKKTGSQVKFHYSNNGLTLSVCTTINPTLSGLVPERYGWVLIKEGDDEKYFAHPFIRTQGFLTRIYLCTVINRYRIDHRPVCPNCGKFMDIVNGKSAKSRYWKCPKTDHYETCQWDDKLLQWMQDYLKVIRKKRAKQKAKYVKAQAEKGKVVIPAVYRRLPWEKLRPQNKL